jgi:hypothetical protein
MGKRYQENKSFSPLAKVAALDQTKKARIFHTVLPDRHPSHKQRQTFPKISSFREPKNPCREVESYFEIVGTLVGNRLHAPNKGLATHDSQKTYFRIHRPPKAQSL